MYINFWYPMATSEELVADKPLKVRAVGQDFVVFRDTEGQAACLSNTCTHRGGSLSAGKIKGDCVECPYHGWQFDAAGQCQRIPSLGPDGKVPGRTRIDAYPVEEKYGMVFAFLGDLSESERPPVLTVQEWEQEGWRSTLQHYAIVGNYERSVENGLDPAHNEFVHDTHGFQGENEEYKIGDMRIEEAPSWGPWGNGFWHVFNAPPLPEGQMQSGRTQSGDLEVGTGHHGPNSLWTYIHAGPTTWFHQYLFERPVDEGNIHLYLLCMRNAFLEEKNDAYMIERNQYVANQDKVVIEELRPVLTPPTTTKEFMVPADKVILMYRDKLKEWDAKGWRIDTDEVDRNAKRVAYAIPSPARREHKGWVLDSIPLIAGDAAAAKLKAAS
ncbi:MAG: aromatic ring-hydroxylating dioxygenase subunit alpha [Gammaproteobacteria bacterium]|nr:aromatic ring-hydroxylating dioxygenase subunit alpha [Gammaproteobacteria bacterium]